MVRKARRPKPRSGDVSSTRSRVGCLTSRSSIPPPHASTIHSVTSSREREESGAVFLARVARANRRNRPSLPLSDEADGQSPHCRRCASAEKVRAALLVRGEAGLSLREVLDRDGKVTSWWGLDVVFGKRVAARLIIKPGPDGVHRAYITTLSRQEWPMRSLPELYRLRWQVELVFTELKQDINLERVPTKDRHAAQVLLWASLVALAVSRTGSAALYPSTDRLGLARRVRPALVTRSLRAMACWLGTALTLPARAGAAIFKTIAREVERGLSATRPDREDSFMPVIPLLSPCDCG